MYLEDVASHVSRLLLYETPKLKRHNVTKCEMTQVILGALIRVITFCVGVTWVQRSCGINYLRASGGRGRFQVAVLQIAELL